MTNTSLQELASGEREKRVIAPPATQRQPKPKPGPSQGLREEGAEAVGLGAEEGAVGGSLDMSQGKNPDLSFWLAILVLVASQLF